MIDFNAPGIAKKVAKEILFDIDKSAIQLAGEQRRTHLGASIIGDKCLRKLWFNFRWVYDKKHDGRQTRLFNRGHREEPRFIELLTHSGYDVRPLDPETGKQWRVNGCNGHFGGSQDGEVILPAKFQHEKPLLLEFKTNGTGAGFVKLCEDGVGIAKPQHSDQMDTYGYYKKYEHALYCNVNKNDDSLHVEIVKLDWKRGAKLEEKAKVIIMSQVAPTPVSRVPEYSDCKYCDFKDVCYLKQPCEKNCRSCSNAIPIDNGQWGCNKWNAVIPIEAIPAGCNEWSSIYRG